MARSVYAIARTEAEAECMIGELHRHGFAADTISVLFPDRRATAPFGFEQHSKTPEIAALGALAGGISGAVIGFLLSVGAWFTPGSLYVSEAGPFFGTMACAALLAAAFGTIGAIIGSRYPEFEAKRFDKHPRSSGVLVSVQCKSQRQAVMARQVFSSYGSSEISITASPAPALTV